MKNKKYLLLATGSFISLTAINNVYANDIEFDKYDSNDIGIEGYFTRTQLLPTNPAMSGIVQGTYYNRPANTRVRRTVKNVSEGYGFPLVTYQIYQDGETGQAVASPNAVMGENMGHQKNGTALKSDPWGDGRVHPLIKQTSWFKDLSHTSLHNVQQHEIKANSGRNFDVAMSGSYLGGASEPLLGGSNATWRYIGYGSSGDVISNSHFLNDSTANSLAGSKVEYIHRSDQKITTSRKVTGTFDGDRYATAKRAAIERLMEKDPEFKTGTIYKNGSLYTGTITVDDWMNAFHLMTDPTVDTPIFRCHWGSASGTYYATIVAPPDPNLTKNVMLSQMVVKNSKGEIVGTFERKEDGQTLVKPLGAVNAGEQLTVSYTLKNMVTTPTKSDVVSVDAGGCVGQEIQWNSPNDYFKYNNWTPSGEKQPTANKKIEGSKTIELQTTYTVPEGQDKIQITGIIGDELAKAGDNNDTTDDTGYVVLNVGNSTEQPPEEEPPKEEKPSTDDMEATNIELLDKNGKVVDYMVPGEEYKTRYTFTYLGEDKKFTKIVEEVIQETVQEVVSETQTSKKFVPYISAGTHPVLTEYKAGIDSNGNYFYYNDNCIFTYKTTGGKYVDGADIYLMKSLPYSGTVEFNDGIAGSVDTTTTTTDKVVDKVVDKVIEKEVPKEETFTFEMIYKRFLPDKKEEEGILKKEETLTELKKGQTFVYTTDLFVYEVPKAEASMKITKAPDEVNADKSNDEKEKKWEYEYDIRVENVRTYAKKEQSFESGNIILGLVYDVVVKAPAQVPTFEFDILTNVKVKDQNLQFVDHVRKDQGKTETVTKDITRELVIPIKKDETGTINTEVYVNAPGNPDKPLDSIENSKNEQFWEVDLDTQENNKGNSGNSSGSSSSGSGSGASSGGTQIIKPYNPNDTNGCPVGTKKGKQTYNITHETLSYNGSVVRYNNFRNTSTYAYYKYNVGTKSSQSKTYTEEYKIEYVNFKSKYTTDKNYGDKGWVNIMKNPDQAKIKAGYGYELEIQVSYKTNALSSQPKATMTRTQNSSNGLFVSKLNTKPNLYKDIYVKAQDGKIYSASGIYGTDKRFEIDQSKSSVNENTGEMTITYKMVSSSSGGVNKVQKIMTDENLKDGKYAIKVWTPVITGFGNIDKANVELCAEENLKFTIDGSMYDDNQDSIVQ